MSSSLATVAWFSGFSDRDFFHFHEIDLTVPVAIIMGNEETGISPEILKKCEEMAKIPLELGVQSLNVSVAAGIAVYETVRQRIS